LKKNNENSTNEKWVGVFGHYGNNNFGDEAIIAAVIQNIRRYIIGAQVACFSINPEDSHEKHGVEAYPIRHSAKKSSNKQQKPATEKPKEKQIRKVEPASGIKSIMKKIPFLVKSIQGLRNVITSFLNLPKEMRFINKSYKTLKKFDLLIVSGSNQFLDNFGGAGGFPYTLLKWTILCKFAGVKIAFAGVGAGPLDRWRSKLYIHIALLMADYLSYRDIGSKDLVEKTMFPINGNISPDLAQSLLFETQNLDINNPIKVGINPMPVYDSRYWYDPDEQKYSDYVDKLVDFSNWLVKKGHPLFLFNTMIKDLNVVDDILDRMDSELKDKVQLKEVNSVDDLMNTIDSADLTVATRFHGTVLSLLAEKPLLGICYYRKSREILTEMGQEKYAVDIDDFTAQQLKDGFEDLIVNFKTAKEQIRIKSNEYKQQLADQYEKIVGLI